MSSIKNVAITGANGAIGSVILEKLQAAAIFNITILRRTGSSATFPSSLQVINVDFDSVESLTAGLKGQDAIISAVGTLAIGPQKKLIDAAIAAGVKRFLPSEFGCDLSNPNARKLPVFAQKVEIEEYIIEKSKGSDLTYTFVYNSSFLDWGLQYDFILKTSDGKPTIFDGGDILFTATTLPSIADGVVGVLKHPEETKNRPVYLKDVEITQNKLLELAKKAAPHKTWEVTEAKVDDLIVKSDARLAQGLYDMETFVPYIFKSLWAPSYGGNFTKTDNELLGLKGKTEEELFEIVKQNVK